MNEAEASAIISESGFFDARYYLDLHADVRASGMDPLLHYIAHGSREYRNPCCEFDTYFYTTANPDVVASDLLPLVHYIVFGRREGRLARPRHALTLDVTALKAKLTARRAARAKPASALNGRAKGATSTKTKARVIRSETVSGKADRLTTALHAHLFYVPIGVEFIDRLATLEGLDHIYLTTPSELDAEFYRRYVQRFHPQMLARATVLVTPNVGRDIAPLVIGLRNEWKKYDLWCHCHTKHSRHVAFGDKWRAYLFDAVLGSNERTDALTRLFADDEKLGLVFPDHYFEIKKFVHIGENGDAVAAMRTRCGVPERMTFEDFPAGSFFWARGRALASLFDAHFSLAEFPEERSQIDGTPAHAVERLLGVFAAARGYKAKRIYAPAANPRALTSYRTVASDETDPVGTRWRRDTPAIYRERVKPLAPASMVVNFEEISTHWIIPDFGPGAGGHMTIFRFVMALSERGHFQTIWVQNCNNHRNPAEALARIREWYRPLGDTVIVRFLPDDLGGISGDALIATDCWTAFPASQMTGFKRRFYFLQDFEPAFHPVGDLYYAAWATYGFGFTALCAGDWLERIAAEQGMKSYAWRLAADFNVYALSPYRALSTPVRIAFYARQYTPRRMVGSGMAALDILRERGVAFEVLFFGEAVDVEALPYPAKSLGVLKPEELARIYAIADIGLVMSGTNYSLVPLEMMAAGLPVVEIDVESTRAVYSEDCVVFAKPWPLDIAEAIETLIGDPAYRKRVIERGYSFVSRFSWDESFAVVDRAIRDELALVARALEPPAPAVRTARSRPKASIFIPTYDAGEAFDGVLKAVLAQKSPEAFEVVVFNSSSRDGTLERLKRWSRRHKNLSVRSIDKSEFQHGRTRDLGIEACRGDHVALITQDALPASETWLAELVAGFALDDKAACVFGRHRAYPDHSEFARRELERMFDLFHCLGPVFSRDRALPGLHQRGLTAWRHLMYFYSDNNSCVRKDYWRQIRYPHVAWGEDHVWAKTVIELGLAKVYADAAVVLHSHDTDPQRQFDIAHEEGNLFRNLLGLDIVPNVQDLGVYLAERKSDDATIAPGAPFDRRRALHHLATLLGRAAGARGERERYRTLYAELESGELTF